MVAKRYTASCAGKAPAAHLTLGSASIHLPLSLGFYLGRFLDHVPRNTHGAALGGRRNRSASARPPDLSPLRPSEPGVLCTCRPVLVRSLHVSPRPRSRTARTTAPPSGGHLPPSGAALRLDLLFQGPMLALLRYLSSPAKSSLRLPTASPLRRERPSKLTLGSAGHLPSPL